MGIVGYYSNVPEAEEGSFYFVVGYWNASADAAEVSQEDESWEDTLQRCDPAFLKLFVAATPELKKFNLVISNDNIEDDVVLDMEGQAFDLDEESGSKFLAGFISIHFPYGEPEDDSTPELESDWSNAPHLKAIADYLQRKYRPIDDLFI
jgi:hypothetical protein